MGDFGDHEKPVFEKPVMRGPSGAHVEKPAHNQKKPRNMNGPLYMQTAGNSNVVLVRRTRRKEDSGWKMFVQWLIENQIGLAFNLLTLLFLAHHFIPKAQSYTAKFLTLSYRNPETGKFGHGLDDCYMLSFFVVLFTGLRAATMEYVLAPFAKTLGMRKIKQLTRFSEQSWMVIYYTVFWVLGVYMYWQSPYFFDLREMWTHWPNREITGLMKCYILAQSAFWIQQVIVLNIEERRKDHWQMLTHHFITCGLLFSCYTYDHTPVGHVILVTMDVTDIFLSLAKCLKYAGFTTVCDVAFGIFLLSWIVFRHIFYPLACWSVYSHTPGIMTTGCFKGPAGNIQGPFPIPEGRSYLVEPFIDSEGLVCYDENVKWGFLVPLLALQVLTLAWFVLVIRVALKVLRGGNAEEVRSDDEGDDVEEDEYIYEEAPLEAEVGVDEIDLKSWERRNGTKRHSSTSGVSLPGHGDRKELLGRIGCEKQVE